MVLNNFYHYQPTRIHFGCGLLNELPEIASYYGRKFLLVTPYENMALKPMFDRVKQLMIQAGYDLVNFQKVTPNPVMPMIDEAIKRPGRFDYVIEIQRPSPEGCKAIFRIHTEKMPVDKHFNKDVFVDKYLVGSSGAEIAFVASEAAYNSIRRTVNIKELFDEKCDFVISKENILIEEDFIKAAKLLKDSRQRADTAKWRNIK